MKRYGHEERLNTAIENGSVSHARVHERALETLNHTTDQLPRVGVKLPRRVQVILPPPNLKGP